MRIKAIETKFNGYRFRSRLEARWAVFFDELNEPYEYEKEGFDLGCDRYLPDFWLPRVGMWVEIKGAEPTIIEKRRAQLLSEGSNSTVMIAIGDPMQCRVAGFTNGAFCKMLLAICPQCENLTVYLWGQELFACGHPYCETLKTCERLENARRCARSARFEFYERNE